MTNANNFSIGRQYTAGYVAAIAYSEPWNESQSRHWKAGYSDGCEARSNKNSKLNKYLESIGVSQIAEIRTCQQPASKPRGSEMADGSVVTTVMPAVGERWRHRKTNQVARVMAVAEKWIIARYKGAMPWVRHWNDFRGEYVRVE